MGRTIASCLRLWYTRLAAEFRHPHQQADLAPSTRQIGDYPLVVAVEMIRRLVTERTGGDQRSGGHQDGEGRGSRLDPFYHEALPKGEHRTLKGQTHEVDAHVLAPVLVEFFPA